MTSEGWLLLNELYHAAVELPADQQQAFLKQACAEDDALRHEVESLIVSHQHAGTFITEPALRKAARALAHERAASLVGRMFAHYRINSLLGVGGMGEVYLAEDTKLDRKVAVKILNEKFSQDEATLTRFIHEAKAASALNHPNIFVIHEVGESGGTHYIVSEFIEGKTLREVLIESELSLRAVLDICIQITGALSAAHEAHLIHCDIKPENVMVRPDGYVKVLDFGLAKLIEQESKPFIELENTNANQTAKGSILGTVNYMSPEQAKGEPVDERADIFGFGVVMYEMISGRLPFAADSPSETIAKLINQEPEALSQVSIPKFDELAGIVFKMLRKDRGERYQTMKEVVADLKDLRSTLLSEEMSRTNSLNERHATVSVQATRDVAIGKSAEQQYDFSKSIKRHKRLAALGLVVFLASAIGLGYRSYAGRKPSLGIGGRASIAVLPVRPIDKGNQDEIYSIGIADSLILKLSSIKGFEVRPLSATRKYAGLDQDPIAAGLEQNVDYVLASNYQLTGSRIRITAELFKVSNGQIEETYKSEKDAADIFTMQDAVASDVGSILSARFGSAPSSATKRGTTNEEAYRLYLQGMYLNGKKTTPDARKAVEVLEQAVKLDPNYAQAWAGAAHAHRTVGNFGGSNKQEEYQKSMEAINKALALDGNLADAHSALCDNKMSYEWDFEGAERECRRAVELDPNSSLGHLVYSRYLGGRGRFDEALAEVKTAIDLEPASLFSQRHYGSTLYYARRYPEAVTQFKRIIAMDKNFGTVYNWIIVALEMQGNYQEAFEWFMKARAVNYPNPDQQKITQAYEIAYKTYGWKGMLLEQIRRYEDSKTDEKKTQPPVYFQGAVLYAKAGNKDRAFQELELSYQNREYWMMLLKVEPGLDSLRDDPRYDQLVKRMGL